MAYSRPHRIRSGDLYQGGKNLEGQNADAYLLLFYRILKILLFLLFQSPAGEDEPLQNFFIAFFAGQNNKGPSSNYISSKCTF